jgi:hypothetical protein
MAIAKERLTVSAPAERNAGSTDCDTQPLILDRRSASVVHLPGTSGSPARIPLADSELQPDNEQP